MKLMILAAVAAIGLGIGAANAQSFSHGAPQQSGPSNFVEGGGG